MSNSLTQLSDELSGAVENAGKSVVAIYAGGRVPSSGVHWKPGFIVTAEHSLRRDEEIKIGFPDGKLVAAELAGRDPGSDLAVLKFDGASLPVMKTGGEASATTGSLNAVSTIHRNGIPISTSPMSRSRIRRASIPLRRRLMRMPNFAGAGLER